MGYSTLLATSRRRRVHGHHVSKKEFLVPKRIFAHIGLSLILACLFGPPSRAAEPAVSQPLVIGETFTMRSGALDETRRINVYRPAWVEESVPLPVVYMPDGGIAEDFLHVAGLVQVSTGNGTMKPVLLVGIENTQRRRDLTGPTNVASDREIAPVVGGSAKFRKFIATELMPEIERRYRTTEERAIVGESLAGLFVLETMVLQPELFDIYIAFDPSLWWNGEALFGTAARNAEKLKGRVVYLANSSEPELAQLTARFARLLAGIEGVRAHHQPMPDEKHSTIYHPAALKAFRAVLAAPQE